MSFTDEAFDHSPSTEFPGWHNWNLTDETLFNPQVIGPMIMRGEDNGGQAQCRLRMFPQRKHLNLQENIHGAVTLALIDIALFATMHTLSKGEAGPSVTLELSTQFVGAGMPDLPLDAVSEVIRETGKLIFLRGVVEQEGNRIAAYSGIVRKLGQR